MSDLCTYCGFTPHPECSTCGNDDDMVNHPPHYTQGAVECIDAIRAALGDEGLVAYCRGNAIKYLWRMGQKGDAVQDLEKAVWYITKAVEVQRG